MQPFLAMIIPVGGNGGQQPPLGIWGPGDPRPTLPIAGWNPGTGAWPTPPTPQPPLVIWGPGDPRPTLPIAGWNPGTGAWPQPPQPGQPPGIWGPTDPRPTLPISGWDPIHGTWPEFPAEIPDLGPVDWKAGWTAQTGWVVIGIPKEGTLVPTPSTTTK